MILISTTWKSFTFRQAKAIRAAAQQGVKIVVNAGGLNPAGLAAAVRELAATLGLTAQIASVQGDDRPG